MRSPTAALATTLAMALALAAVAATARADVDAEIVGNAKISGTLAPEGEVETLRFEATAGSTLTLALAAKKKAPLDFTMTLYGPDGSEVSFDDAAKVIDKDKKVAVKKLPLTQSGSYRLDITATGTGEYALKLKARPAMRVSRTVALDAGTAGEAAIAAPAGSTVTIRAAAPKGDASLPRIDAVGGIDVNDLAGPKGNKHTVKVVLGPDQGGDLVIALTNTSAGNGTVSLQATIKPRKVKVTKLDVRGASRGAPSGGETVVVRSVGTLGGQVGIDNEASRIDGVLLTVPPGALASPAAISISTSAPIAAPGDGNQSAGEAVEFGPDGLEFETSATVVLPFDLSALPIGTDPENDILVVRETSSGETEVITPTSVDVGAGTVTVPASGFSTFMAFVPAGSPNLDGADYWYLGFSIGLAPDGNLGFDSRERDLDLSIASVSFGPRSTADAVTVTSEFRDVTWTHDQDGVGSFPVMTSGTDVTTGSWDYAPDGRTVTVDTGPASEDAIQFVVSGDGSVLLGGTTDDGDPGSVGFDLAARKMASPSLAALAGSYYLGAFEFAAPGDSGFGPLETSLSRAFATFTLNANGTWSLRGSEHVLDFVPGDRFRTEGESLRETGTARMGTAADGMFEDALIFLTDQKGDDEIDTFAALPGEGGRVLIGADLLPLGDGQFFFFMVRQSNGASKAALDGEYETISIEVEPTTYETFAQSIGPVVIGDFATCGYHTIIDLDGTGNAREVSYTGVCYRRDEGQSDGIFTDISGGADDEDDFAVKVSADGKVTIPDREPAVGAMVSDGSFFFVLEDPRNATPYFDLVLGVRPPPFVD